MSNVKEIFQKDMKEAIDFAQAQEELKKKQFSLTKKRVEEEYKESQRNEEELKIAASVNLGTMSLNQIDQLRKSNAEYIAAAQKPMKFICNAFSGSVPFFRKNCIVIGAPTGQGKTTLLANACMSVMMQKNPQTGKKGRVLVISNEEASEDVFNRITALIKGFSYTNHNEFTLEQRQILDTMMPMLAKDGWLTVIGNNYFDDNGNMITGLTSTTEGIKAIFDNLLKNNEIFDAVIIDYYQNVSSSKNNSKLNQYQAQEKFCQYLDDIKNVYPAPIVVLAQIKKDDGETPYDIRIKGAKMLATKATVFIEMETDIENHRTKCTVRKGRYVKGIGKEFYVGYDKGKFVDYDVNFQIAVNALKEKKQMDGLKKEK